jgi:adenosylmethionine-8-amino-7-oxononanoate aminotransferase
MNDSPHTAEHQWLNQHRAGRRLPKAIRGDGTFVVDETGKRYLDGSAGPALFCVGHGRPAWRLCSIVRRSDVSPETVS